MSRHASFTTSQFFDQAMADAYDQRNSALQPISESLHFLMALTLRDLPAGSRVLCVGVGTGAEILSLATAFPGWSFVGVDPSGEMLAVARKRLGAAGFLNRCELVEGRLQTVSEGDFDAVVCLLVAHFIAEADRPAFYAGIHDRLKPGGRLVSAEISCDLDAPGFPELLEDWKGVQALMGATPESLAKLETMMREVLCIVRPAETEALWREAGFPQPVAFFQAFAVRGWHATRP
jgi:tRNA (cmo5U34)-methyltransferase